MSECQISTDYTEEREYASSSTAQSPDLQYFNHRYYMYYVASWTQPMPAYNSNGGSAVGVLTATLCRVPGPIPDRRPVVRILLGQSFRRAFGMTFRVTLA